MPARDIQVRKHDLAITLQKVGSHPTPRVELEQYTIPADMAAEILFTACYVHDDIHAKRVLDLGTGTGRLALGASILGAEYVVGVDIDSPSLRQALIDKTKLQAHVDFVLGNLDCLHGPLDTVVMNPPFGTKTRHADTEFLQVALKLGNVVYSIHKSSTRKFLEHWLQIRSFSVLRILSSEMDIKHQFEFHYKRRHAVSVDVFRICRRM